MSQVITDRRDIDFVLYEQFKVEELTQHEKFAEFNKKTFDLIINEANLNQLEKARIWLKNLDSYRDIQVLV